MGKRKANVLGLPPANLPFEHEAKWLEPPLRLIPPGEDQPGRPEERGSTRLPLLRKKSEEGNQKPVKSGVEDGAAEGGGTLRWRLDEYGG